MTKQPFTIEGSVALKKALLEETGIPLNCEEALNFPYLTVHKQGRELEATSDKSYTHYQLPQDWGKAVAAVKDFFAEERFEKGKWYYAELDNESYLVRYSHYEKDRAMYVTEHIHRCKDEVAYYKGDTLYIKIIDCLQPATTDQIQFMLRKVVEQKGFIEGARVTCLFSNAMDIIQGECEYDKGFDRLWVEGTDNLINIYEKGKWAELAPQEEAKPQTLVLKDVMVIEEINEELNRFHCMDLHLTPTHIQQLKAYMSK
jgi:hypothetical protein